MENNISFKKIIVYVRARFFLKRQFYFDII